VNDYSAYKFKYLRADAMKSARFEIKAGQFHRGRFGIIIALSWGNQTMEDMKAFARILADEAKQKLASLAEADRIQLHRARVLDAESRAFWAQIVSELSLGIAEYDSCLAGTAVEQKRLVEGEGSTIAIRWRYPRPQEIVVAFDFERRLITFAKRNLNDPGKASKELRLNVDRDDKLFSADDRNVPVGGATETAQAILKFMLAGSMA
jgi:hypothetical protein